MYLYQFEFFVVDSKMGNNEWKICRSSDLHFSVETFATQEQALKARSLRMFSILEY